jgi:hypothetical protein
MSSSKSTKNRKVKPSHKEIENSKPKGDIQEEKSENREVQEMKTEDSNDDTDAGRTVKPLQGIPVAPREVCTLYTRVQRI